MTRNKRNNRTNRNSTISRENIYRKSHKIYGVTITLTKHIEANPKNILSMEDLKEKMLERLR